MLLFIFFFSCLPEGAQVVAMRRRGETSQAGRREPLPAASRGGRTVLGVLVENGQQRPGAQVSLGEPLRAVGSGNAVPAAFPWKERETLRGFPQAFILWTRPGAGWCGREKAALCWLRGPYPAVCACGLFGFGDVKPVAQSAGSR